MDGADHTAYVVSGSAVVPAYKGEMIVKCAQPPADPTIVEKYGL
jgi:hypothetical protein